MGLSAEAQLHFIKTALKQLPPKNTLHACHIGQIIESITCYQTNNLGRKSPICSIRI